MGVLDPVQPGLFGAGLADVPPWQGYDARGAAACLGMEPTWRRKQGITLTPQPLVEMMLCRVAAAGSFDTLVDPGAGTGRFCIAAARKFPKLRMLAIERDPEMLDVLRRNLAVEGLADRVTVLAGDFREVPVALQGRCVFVGNPPFVRHHDIEPHWKHWYAAAMARFGQAASQLAGLHLHFLARVTQLARAGDHLCFVTSAEWLDNGYGSAWRALLSSPAGPLHLSSLWVADAHEAVFPDALVSAVVFEASAGPGLHDVELGALRKGGLHLARTLAAPVLALQDRWTGLCQTDLTVPATGIELGELFRVTRGQVTGMNEAWVLPVGSLALPPTLTLPAVTRAREIIDGTVEAADALVRLRRVANLPTDLATLPTALRAKADNFLTLAHAKGAAAGYVAQQRRSWHALDLREPPLAMVSYMGRRPPVFRSNPHGVSYLNIAHGLYAREPLAADTLRRVLDFLNTNIQMRDGRMYGGGMAKFEPSDIKRLRVPPVVLDPVA